MRVHLATWWQRTVLQSSIIPRLTIALLTGYQAVSLSSPDGIFSLCFIRRVWYLLSALIVMIALSAALDDSN